MKKLDRIVEARLNHQQSLSLAPKLVGLPLFGGIDRETGEELETGTFQYAFVPSRCIAAWRKVGAATEDGITRAYLNDKQVMNEMGVVKETDEVYAAIQTANDLAIHALTLAGYDAQWLQATLEKKNDESNESICVPNTAARQERLALARGHGGRFHASNGMHITENDIFIAFEIRERKEARAAAEKDKKRRQRQQLIESNALDILSDEGASPESYSVKDLDCLLAWHQVKDLPPKAKKEDKIARWKEIVASQKPPPPYERWTDEDEQRLVTLQSEDAIGIEDTMFGREVALKKRELEAAASHFTREERAAMRRKLEAMDEAEDAAAAVAAEEPMQQPADTATEGERDAA